MKRINNEIQNFNMEKYNMKYMPQKTHLESFFATLTPYLLIEHDVNKDTCVLQILEITNWNAERKIIVELGIDECYPFRPFIVNKFNFEKNLKGLTFAKYLVSLNTNIAKQGIDISVLGAFFKIQYLREPIFLNLKENMCFCCKSITCYMLWSPSFTFKHLLYEYLEITFIEKYSTLANYCELLRIYNILFSKFPNEIICKIISYI